MSWLTEFVTVLGGELAVTRLENLITEHIAEIIDLGCDPNAIDKDKITPVWVEALTNTEREVPLLLLETLFEKGARIPCLSDGGGSLLHTALANNVKPEIIMLLLEQGAVASFVDENGDTALRYALSKGSYDLHIIQSLVEAGASVTQMNDNEVSPILEAAKYGASPDILAYLLENGADANDTDFEEESVLGYYCTCSYYGESKSDLLKSKGTTILDTLLTLGASANEIDSLREDILGSFASKAFSGEEVIELLISHDADVNHKNDRDYSPLAILCEKDGNSDLMDILVNAGADIDEMNNGMSLLMIALALSNTSAALKVLELGISNIDVVHEETGKTALHFACENYVQSTVSALIAHGSNHTCEDKEHNKPVDLIKDEDDKAAFLLMVKERKGRKI